MPKSDEIKRIVKERYAKAAVSAREGTRQLPKERSFDERAISKGYGPDELASLPETVTCSSLGCGNPTALGNLRLGDVVLDLGSGGGIDVFLAARRVGPSGKVYGLDMTDEMLDLARENQRKAAIENVEFLKGEMEDMPLPDASVDIIISNCVINLSADKDKVIREAFRVLRPGGRLAVSDIVVRGELPKQVRRDMEAWAGCVAGALKEEEYLDKLQRAGFQQVALQVTKVYGPEGLRSTGCAPSSCCGGSADQGSEGRLLSAFISATKLG